MAPAAITCHHLPALCQHAQGQAVVDVLRLARLPGIQFETGGLWLALPHQQIVALDPGIPSAGVSAVQRSCSCRTPAAAAWRGAAPANGLGRSVGASASRAVVPFRPRPAWRANTRLACADQRHRRLGAGRDGAGRREADLPGLGIGIGIGIGIGQPPIDEAVLDLAGGQVDEAVARRLARQAALYWRNPDMGGMGDP